MMLLLRTLIGGTVLLTVLIATTCGRNHQCSSCGMDCERVCGTLSFRGCCMNFIRKRSGVQFLPPIKRQAQMIDVFDRFLIPTHGELDRRHILEENR